MGAALELLARRPNPAAANEVDATVTLDQADARAIWQSQEQLLPLATPLRGVKSVSRKGQT